MIGQDLVCTLYGKPFQISYDYAKQKLNELASELGSQQIDTIYAIGDNPLSGKYGLYTRVLYCLTRWLLRNASPDIKGANQMGWFSILVRTGCFQGDKENDTQYPAKHVCPSVKGKKTNLWPNNKKKK